MAAVCNYENGCYEKGKASDWPNMSVPGKSDNGKDRPIISGQGKLKSGIIQVVQTMWGVKIIGRAFSGGGRQQNTLHSNGNRAE